MEGRVKNLALWTQFAVVDSSDVSKKHVPFNSSFRVVDEFVWSVSGA